MLFAMLNGWEITLVLAVAVVLLAARRGFQPDLAVRYGKKALFYCLMTLGAIAIGCLLAFLMVRLGE